MSQNERIRSKLLIGAVMKAAAAGDAQSFASAGKFAAIGGLAGLVPRTFRSRGSRPWVPSLEEPRPRSPARIQQGSSKGDRRKPVTAAGKRRRRFGGFDRSWASSTDEAYQERLRLIVSAPGFPGPADRRQGIPVCDQQTPRNPPRRRLVEGAS